MTRQINAKGQKFFEASEGRKRKAYLDSGGVPTIGVGHTGPEVKLGLVWTDAQIDAAFQKDMAKHAARVERYIKVPLTDDQFTTLVSFDYNTGAIATASFVKLLNNGHYEAVPNGLRKYVKDQDKTGKLVTVKGLVNRREAEVALWKGAMQPATKKKATAVAAVGLVSTTAAAASTSDDLTNSIGTVTQAVSLLGTGGSTVLAVAAGAVLLGLGGFFIYRTWFKGA